MPKGGYLCPDCGAESSRKWNLQRHINVVHGQSKNKSQPTKIVRNTLGGPRTVEQRLPKKTETFVPLSEILNKRINMQLRLQATRIAPDRNSRFHGCICRRCLCPYLKDEGKSVNRNASHDCDELWLIDYPGLESRRDAIFQNLEKRIPYLMAEIIEANEQIEASLTCFKVHADVSLELPKKPDPTPDLFRNYILLEPYNRELNLIQNSDMSAFVPIQIERREKDYWGNRVITDSSTRLDENELVEFLSTRNRTYGLFKTSNDSSVYYFQLSFSRKGNFDNWAIR